MQREKEGVILLYLEDVSVSLMFVLNILVKTSSFAYIYYIVTILHPKSCSAAALLCRSEGLNFYLVEGEATSADYVYIYIRRIKRSSSPKFPACNDPLEEHCNGCGK